MNVNGLSTSLFIELQSGSVFRILLLQTHISCQTAFVSDFARMRPGDSIPRSRLERCWKHSTFHSSTSKSESSDERCIVAEVRRLRIWKVPWYNCLAQHFWRLEVRCNHVETTCRRRRIAFLPMLFQHSRHEQLPRMLRGLLIVCPQDVPLLEHSEFNPITWPPRNWSTIKSNRRVFLRGRWKPKLAFQTLVTSLFGGVWSRRNKRRPSPSIFIPRINMKRCVRNADAGSWRRRATRGRE